MRQKQLTAEVAWARAAELLEGAELLASASGSFNSIQERQVKITSLTLVAEGYIKYAEAVTKCGLVAD